MAFSLSQHHLSPSSSTFNPPPKHHLPPLSHHLNFPPSKPTSPIHLRFTSLLPKSTQESQNNDTQQPNTPNSDEAEDMAELGKQIKKAIEEREEKGESFLSGVAEEIREIEWPVFGKVLGTTGVVLGVIAGSSVVLLTVNAVLAQLSDSLFAGKGVQDFFS